MILLHWHGALQQKIVNAKKFFRIGFCEELQAYIMETNVAWIANYDRYYAISEEDFRNYETAPERFCEKYSREIGQKQDCFTENFIGSSALRDYDGRIGFQNEYPAARKNPFAGYGYAHGILYAHIVWKNGEFFVPPIQKTQKQNDEWVYPLRESCTLLRDSSGMPLCYCLNASQ